MNYVFPAKSRRNKSGFCSFLAKTFYLTNPIPYSVARTLFGHSAVQSALRPTEEDFRRGRQGLEMNYMSSEPGSIELLLKEMKAHSVNEP